MNKIIYTQKMTYLRYDSAHYEVFLNEEVIENYVPENSMNDNPEPITAYAYTGSQPDGSTLIASTSDDRDSLINGIIRSRYTQTEEDAIKTHQIILLNNPDHPKKEEYQKEWEEFNSTREAAIDQVDAW